MTQFNLDVDGEISLAEELDDLEDEYTTDATYRVSSSAEYDIYLERGTRHHPPYPFFAPAIREAQATGYLDFIEETVNMPVEEMSAQEIVRWLAASLSRQMKWNVTAQAAGGRSPGTHPEHPRVQTGNLRSGIGFTRIR